MNNQDMQKMAPNTGVGAGGSPVPTSQHRHEDLHAAVEGMSAINAHIAEILARVNGCDVEEYYMIPDKISGITLRDVLTGDAEILRTHESVAHDLINKIEQALF